MKNKLLCIIFIGMMIVPSYVFSQNNRNILLTKKIKVGDILFQNTGSNELDEAIKDVTKTKKAMNYTHVGIAVIYKKKLSVLEAISDGGVVITGIEDFLNRSKNQRGDPLVSVYRLKKPYHKNIKGILEYGIPLLGKPYDHLFLWDDNAMYCSELVYKVLGQVLNKNGITTHPFPTHPMTFKNKKGIILPEWQAYYDKLKHRVPEGKKGTNPNLMASTKHIQWIGSFY